MRLTFLGYVVVMADICLHSAKTNTKFRALDFIDIHATMAFPDQVEAKNELWRRISARLRPDRVLAFARRVKIAFQRFNPCVGPRPDNDSESEIAHNEHELQEMLTNPFYDGPMSVVPWSGPKFQYPEGRFLNNSELMQQLNILELRFQRQQEILVERGLASSGAYRKLVTRSGKEIPRLTDKRFNELGALVEKVCRNNEEPKSKKKNVRGIYRFKTKLQYFYNMKQIRIFFFYFS